MRCSHGSFARATMDIDLLAQYISNDTEHIRKVFYDIFSIECDDALRFDLGSLNVINITEFKEYHGVNVSIMGYLERTRIPVSLGLANGRYKDFYDIYMLSANYDLDGSKLKYAIVETFTHRETSFNDIAAFEADFTEDSVRQRRWQAFIKKKRAIIKIGFAEVIERSKKLLMPIVEAVEQIKNLIISGIKIEKIGLSGIPHPIPSRFSLQIIYFLFFMV